MHTARPRTLGTTALSLIVFATLGSVGCQRWPTESDQSPVSFAASAATNRVTFDIDEVAFSPCTGEDVHWIGTTTVLDHTTSNRDAPPGQQHMVEVDVTHLDGVGLTTGGGYRFNSVPKFDGHSESPVNPYPVVAHFQRRDVVIGPRGAIGFLTVGFTIVVNGTGDLVLDREDFDFLMECK